MSHFQDAVSALFQNWTALQLAVEQGAAGPESAAIAQWMVQATVQWFAENKNLECYEVEDFLSDIVNAEFNVLIDDGSLPDISQKVCEFYALSQKSDTSEFLKRLQALPQKCDLSRCKVENPSEDQPEASTMEVDQDIEQPEKADPDGWTVVTRKKK
jgi:hypothetical protein